jgi:hypothetical protein
VQSSVIFTWGISGVGGDDEEITNFNPFFGTDGPFAVPEPTTLMLLGGGLAVAGMRRRKKR